MLKPIANSAVKSSSETAGVANRVDGQRDFKYITFVREVDWAMTRPRILWHSVLNVTKKSTIGRS